MPVDAVGEAVAQAAEAVLAAVDFETPAADPSDDRFPSGPPQHHPSTSLSGSLERAYFEMKRCALRAVDEFMARRGLSQAEFTRRVPMRRGELAAWRTCETSTLQDQLLTARLARFVMEEMEFEQYVRALPARLAVRAEWAVTPKVKSERFLARFAEMRAKWAVMLAEEQKLEAQAAAGSPADVKQASGPDDDAAAAAATEAAAAAPERGAKPRKGADSSGGDKDKGANDPKGEVVAADGVEAAGPAKTGGKEAKQPAAKRPGHPKPGKGPAAAAASTAAPSKTGRSGKSNPAEEPAEASPKKQLTDKEEQQAPAGPAPTPAAKINKIKAEELESEADLYAKVFRLCGLYEERRLWARTMEAYFRTHGTVALGLQKLLNGLESRFAAEKSALCVRLLMVVTVCLAAKLRDMHKFHSQVAADLYRQLGGTWRRVLLDLAVSHPPVPFAVSSVGWVGPPPASVWPSLEAILMDLSMAMGHLEHAFVLGEDPIWTRAAFDEHALPLANWQEFFLP